MCVRLQDHDMAEVRWNMVNSCQLTERAEGLHALDNSTAAQECTTITHVLHKPTVVDSNHFHRCHTQQRGRRTLHTTNATAVVHIATCATRLRPVTRVWRHVEPCTCGSGQPICHAPVAHLLRCWQQECVRMRTWQPCIQTQQTWPCTTEHEGNQSNAGRMQ